MSDTRPSLSHLRELHAKGTPGEYGDAIRKARSLLEFTWNCEKCGARHMNDMRGDSGEHDRLCWVDPALLARALLTSHNALAALLAIAEAAVRYADAYHMGGELGEALLAALEGIDP